MNSRSPHPLRTHPRRRALARLALAAVIVPAIAALTACAENPDTGPAAARPTAVGVIELQAESVSLTTELPGRTKAAVVAEIRPQVSGIVQERLFPEGAMVEAGQTLYQIDPASYQADHAGAQAAVAKAKATAAAARLTARRRAELAKVDAISQQDLQDAQAASQQAQADLASARATLETARINLERTRITSPIAGRVDVSSVTRGALVTADQAAVLTTVRQVDPIQVDVTQSSAELLRLKRELAAGQLVRAGSDAKVKLMLEDGSTYDHDGRISIEGVSVDVTTGAVTLRAVFPNPEGLLLPGMYVRAQLPTAVAAERLLVPQQSVRRDATGAASVLVVDAQNTVRQREIATDRAVGNRWLVGSGLAAGDKVVFEGGQKVKPGDVVQAQSLSPTKPAPAAVATR